MMSIAISSFGGLLKALRQRRHLTQKKLAAMLGVHYNTISIWERGDYLPESKTVVLELARQLELDDGEARRLLEASLTAVSPHWSVPFARNPFFTGREEILEQLHTCLGVDQVLAFSQVYAISGLGGIGKTQTALEYAYRYGLSYTAVFWIGAESHEQVLSSLLRIAEVLELPERAEADQKRIIAAVQRWLSTHQQWLLIWDNLEELDLLQRFLPPVRQGAILLTTRHQALGTLAQGVDLLPMGQEEGVRCVLSRAKVLEAAATSEQVQQFAARVPAEYAAVSELVTVLGGLPLALDQAGAYIEETGCNFADYLGRYEQRRAHLLWRRGSSGSDHPQSVAATFLLALEQVEQVERAAADLLRLCAFLYAEAIPEEVLVERARHVGNDSLELDQAIAVLRNYSLVQRSAPSGTLSIHRLVQAVVREQMCAEERKRWLKQVIAALQAVFPEVSYNTWKDCERLLPHVLAVAAAVPAYNNDKELAGLLQKTATYLTERAQYEQAERLYERALRMREEVLGAQHAEVASVLNGLAFLFYEQGRYKEAEPLYERALHIWEQVQGVEHPEVASVLNGLALLLCEQGRYKEAEPLYERALHIWEQTLGPEHPDIAPVLNGLAFLFCEQGRYKEAEPLYERALHIREQALGLEHPEVASVLNRLALLFWHQGKYKEAEALYERALRIREQAQGPEHPYVAIILNNLAILFYKQGQYEEARRLYERALRIWERVVGSEGTEHPYMAGVLNNLAEVSYEQGQYEEAKRLYERALRIWEETLGPEHPNVADVLNNLAEVFYGQGRYEEARPLYERALHIKEQAQGEEHPEIAISLNGLANLSCEQGKYEEARQLYERALYIREQASGPEHPETAQILHGLATFHEKQGHLCEAISFARRALEVRTKSLGSVHPKTVEARMYCAQLVEAQEERLREQKGKEVQSQWQQERVQTQASPMVLESGSPSSGARDPFHEFLRTCCDRHPHAWSRSADLWQAYQQWARDSGESYLLSQRRFLAALKAEGYQPARTNRSRIWRGIALKHPPSEGS